MKDRRSVDDLSIDELEKILARKKREAREARLRKFRQTGRAVALPESEGGSAPTGIGSLRSVPVDENDLPKPPKSRTRKILDGGLLLIEIGAVVGLVYLLFNGLGLVDQLNREVAQALVQPTLTPTSIITVVVLPSGHTPPTSPGGAQPNEAEVPEALRPLLQSLPPVAIPTQGPQQAIRIQVPAIGVDAPVVQGDGWEQLKKGVAQHLGTPDPGQAGNIVLSGHNDIFGEVFRDLDQLQAGDEITLHTAGKTYTYVITGSKIVKPTDVNVMDPTRHPSLTLISCYPYRVDDKRIVVFADLRDN